MAKLNQKLLVVEDDVGLQNQLKWCFEDYQPSITGSRAEAMKLIRRESPSVVISDLGLPPDPGGNTEGFALLQEIISFNSDIKVIVVTGHEETENAVEAIGLGAYDFYQKPIDADTLKFVVERAFRLIELENANRKLLQEQSTVLADGLIGNSPKMEEVFRTIEKVAETSVSILLLGETGTGKSALTKAIHAKSDRREENLVTINCTSIPEALLESELFGHEKGAFTGAVSKKIGKFEFASGGTLFLDEIGDMPQSLQAKLLHVLQEKKIVRLGGNEEIPVDARIICATHQDLKKRIEENLFREDLYYRIGEISIKVPPLRERGEDITVLAQSFLNRYLFQQNKPSRKLGHAVINVIQSYNWPGNIRELENRIKRAVVMSDQPTISLADMEFEGMEENFTPVILRDVRAKAETEAIIKSLIRSKTVSEAADNLGITRPTLYNLVEKYGLSSYLANEQERSPT